MTGAQADRIIELLEQLILLTGQCAGLDSSGRLL